MRRISTKIALPLLLGIASSIAVACGTENPDPNDVGGSGGGSSDIGDGEGGEPNTGGGNSDGTGGNDTDGAGGGSGGDGQGGEGGEGSGGTPPLPPEEEIVLPECPDEANETVSGGPIDGEDCWDFTVCKGVDTPQFLNQCSGTCLEPFDNFDRIVGFTGTLPNL
jgi:hypothetical protein